MIHTTTVRTRFCETDALGHVNNVSYFIYLEQARVDMMTDLGLVSGKDDWPFILASVKCDFKAQAYVNQRIAIFSSVKRIGQKSFTLYHELRDENDRIIATGEAVLVKFDFVKQESVPLDGRLKELLAMYLAE